MEEVLEETLRVLGVNAMRRDRGKTSMRMKPQRQPTASRATHTMILCDAWGCV